MGNKPARYAASSVPGSRSAPIPAISVPTTICGAGNAQRVGAGSTGKTSDGSLSRIPQKMLVPTRAVVVAVIVLLALPLVGAPAHAVGDEPSPSAATLRAQADTIAARYFDALARFESLDREITENKQVVDELAVRRVQPAPRLARARSPRTGRRPRSCQASWAVRVRSALHAGSN